MELDLRLGAQLGIMVATIAAGYSVVKNQLSRVIEDLDRHIKAADEHKADFDTRLDDAESQRAVFNSQISTLSQINSVSELAGQNREMGELQARLRIAETQIAKLQDLHNGKHPTVTGN